MLRQIRGLVEKLGNLETTVGGLLEDDSGQKERLERMRSFQVRTDLSPVSSLFDAKPEINAELPALVLQRLAPFIEGGLWIQKSPLDRGWRLHAFVTKGEFFPLAEGERLSADHLAQPLAPDQVLKGNAEAMLAEIPIPFAPMHWDTQAFLMMPVPETAFILISDIPALWREDHVRAILNLINRAFKT
jgi:hypothetical protein